MSIIEQNVGTYITWELGGYYVYKVSGSQVNVNTIEGYITKYADTEGEAV